MRDFVPARTFFGGSGAGAANRTITKWRGKVFLWLACPVRTIRDASPLQNLGSISHRASQHRGRVCDCVGNRERARVCAESEAGEPLGGFGLCAVSGGAERRRDRRAAAGGRGESRVRRRIG